MLTSTKWFDTVLLPLKPQPAEPWEAQRPEWFRLRRKLLLLWTHLATAQGIDYDRLRATVRLPRKKQSVLPATPMASAAAAVALGRALTHHNTVETAAAFLQQCDRSIFSTVGWRYLQQVKTLIAPRVESNLRCVRKVVGLPCFTRARLQGFGADLFQCGVVGLWRAVQAFEPERGFRFSTYALPWIKQEMSRNLHTVGTPVVYPEHIHTAAGQVTRLVGHQPLEYDEQVATVESALGVRTVTAQAAVTMQQSRGTDGLSYEGAALEMQPDLQNSAQFTFRDPDQALALQAVQERVHAALARIVDVRIRTILAARFGLQRGLAGDESDSLTLHQLGVQYNLTRERIRQLEHTGLTMLRPYLADLADCVND